MLQGGEVLEDFGHAGLLCIVVEGSIRIDGERDGKRGVVTTLEKDGLYGDVAFSKGAPAPRHSPLRHGVGNLPRR